MNVLQCKFCCLLNLVSACACCFEFEMKFEKRKRMENII